MEDSAGLTLLSTGTVARQVGLSVSGLKKAAREGRIPSAITIVGSGRRVWRAEDVPVVLAALQQGSQRKSAA